MSGISRKLHRMVAMPSLNITLAIDEINSRVHLLPGVTEMIPVATGEPNTWERVRSERRRIRRARRYAQAIMERHPRGKGTTKNRDLRMLYAAAYSIHRAKGGYVVNEAGRVLADKRLTAKRIEALRNFDRLGRSHTNVTTPAMGLALHDLGLVDGLGDDEWLTDVGIKALELLDQRDARGKREQAQTVGSKFQSLFEGAVAYSRGTVTGRYEEDTDVPNILVLFAPRPTTDFIEFGGVVVPRALDLLKAMGVPEEA